MDRLAGTGRLLLLQLRTVRLSLLLTTVVVAGTVTAVMTGVANLYATAADRASYAATLGRSPATAAFNGPPSDLDVIGGIGVYEVGLFGLLLLPAMVLLLSIRVSRAQEDVGRADLLTSMQVGRLAPLAAAMLTVAGVVVASALIVLGGVVRAGYDPGGTARYAVALALFLLAAAGLGFLCAETSQSARSAGALAFAGLGGAYAIRAVIDGRFWDLPWTTPMGWFGATSPYGPGAPWWPYAALAALSLALHAGALAVRARRDLGGGLVAPRRGPTEGTVRTPLGLALHVVRGATLGWAIGAAAWGAAAGLLSEEMRTVLRDNAALGEALIGSADSPDELMTYIGSSLIGLIATAAALQAVTRYAAEESVGRTGVVLSATVSRRRYWTTCCGVAGAALVLTLLAGGLAFGVSALATGATLGTAVEAALVTLSYVAPGAVIVAVALALLAVSPRIAVAGWAVLLWATVVALLGETLQLPQWARNLSPIELLGKVPVDPVAPGTWVALLGSALVVVALTVPWVARRDLAAG
ncbi:ABC transporter permease [Nocardioides hungaricus]